MTLVFKIMLVFVSFLSFTLLLSEHDKGKQEALLYTLVLSLSSFLLITLIK